MKTMRIAMALAFAAALVACNQQNAAKSQPPADSASQTETGAAPAADTGAKPGEAAPAGAGDAGKPAAPAQTPAGGAPDKPG